MGKRKKMDRRNFAQAMLKTSMSAALLGRGASPVSPAAIIPRFKLSVMLWTVFRELPFEQRLERVAEAGYSGVELVNEFDAWSDEDFRRANAKKRELRLTFDATAGVATGAADPEKRESFQKDVTRLLGIAQKLECPSIILLSGDRVADVPREAQHNVCADNLKWAGDFAAKQGATAFLETIDPEENPNVYLTSVSEAAEIVRKVNRPNVKLLYDFYHEQIAEGNLIAKLERYFDLIGLVHIADVPGRHEPGTGEINYAKIFRKLADLGYEQYVAMEFFPTGEPVGTLRSARELATNRM
jgi:hydroxypyruvate isomerase